MPKKSKTLKRLSFLIGMTLLAGCSSETYLDEPTASDTSQPGICNASRLTLEEAITRAEETLDKKGTRSQGLVSVDYVLRSDTEKMTRSTAELNDTLAYIINFPDEKGFAIIAADKRVSNVLAYAPSGNFDKNVPIVKEAFLSLVGPYVESCSKATRTDPGIQDPPKPQTYYTIPSIIDIPLHQGTPWNKYVTIQHPFCPAGCEAIAVANIMSHCQDSIQIENHTYKFKQIVPAIEAGPPPYQFNRSIIGPGGGTIIGGINTMTYKGAVDEMAKFIYDIGKEGNLNITYGQYGSSGTSQDAYNFIKRTGYETSTYSKYSKYGLFQLVKNGYLVHIDGIYEETSTARLGHAWVIDGCQYPDVGGTAENYYDEIYYWCNWGAGGVDNGYYCNDVYSPDHGHSYKLNEMFGVKINNTFKTR